MLYLVWHRPIGAVKRSIREGGPVEQWITERGRREMEAAASRLGLGIADCGLWGSGPHSHKASEALKRNSEFENKDSRKREKPVEVQMLTGMKYWYQTAFCLHSLQQVAGREVVPVVHDDGTLKKEHAEVFKRICRGARFDWLAEIESRIERVLPRAKFPFLRKRRDELPLIRKITDIHAGREGCRLFLDSDLLFFRKPDFLLDWWDRPDHSIHAVDVINAYGYPLEVLAQVGGQPVPEKVNTGITGLKSDEIDWERMEKWCRALTQNHPASYYQEQALVALHLAEREREAISAKDYVTLPDLPEASECRAVMHHYVDLSKKHYFRGNWRRVL